MRVSICPRLVPIVVAALPGPRDSPLGGLMQTRHDDTPQAGGAYAQA